MKVFFDSSAFAKRYIEEPGSQAVEDICRQASALAQAVICVPEIISALNRLVREKTLSRKDYRKAKQSLAADIRDIEILDLTPTVISQAIALLEENPIRAMDALHLACAWQWDTQLFVSSDRKQIAAAKKARLKTRLV
jgi:predicted nucleic acid-binding protein